MGRVGSAFLDAIEGPILGLIRHGTKGLIQGLENAAVLALGGPQAAFAFAVTTFVSELSAPKASKGGSPDSWKADPDAGMDIVIGDACNSGHLLYRQAYGDTNKYQTLTTHWSIGPVQSIDQLYVDQVPRGVAGGVVDIADRGKMHEARQLGACPEPRELNVAPINPWAWTSAHKLSGKAATMVTVEYDADDKDKKTLASVPACAWRGKGVLCYDLRKDSTYPGGAGPQRASDQSTWTWSDNPFVVALTWCIGWRQNGKLVAGVGLPLAGLILEQFVEGANVCNANGWRVGGVRSTADDKWDVLKDILQAGGGEPMRLGALLGCTVRTPRVPLATITRDDLAQGDISVVAVQARRDRINAAVPRYQAEQVATATATDGSTTTTVTWSDVAGVPIIVDDYVAADGRQRRREVTMPLVQCFDGEQPTQAAQLARYAIEDAREFGPITLPLKIRWMGYKPGDVVTVDLPEAGLHGQDVMLLTRSLEPSTAVVSITARSETAGKHAFALGQTMTPPATPSLPAFAWQVQVPGLAAVEQQVVDLSTAVSGQAATIDSQGEMIAGQSDDLDALRLRVKKLDGGEP